MTWLFVVWFVLAAHTMTLVERAYKPITPPRWAQPSLVERLEEAASGKPPLSAILQTRPTHDNSWCAPP